MELVVLPSAVNIASPALYDVVKRVLGRVRGDREVSEIEIMEVISDSGDRMVVIRSRREEFGDGHGAAITYHQLGIVAQEPRRFEQAERCYRQALDIYLERGERHLAAITYQRLGEVTFERGQPIEAVEATLSAAVLVYAEIGMWPTVGKLHAQAQYVTSEAFERLVQEIIPPDGRDGFLMRCIKRHKAE